MSDSISLDLMTLHQAYIQGTLTPSDMVRELYQRLHRQNGEATWIHLLDKCDVLARAQKLETMDHRPPLWGIPFAVKDNIDVAGLPTTAACPAYAYTPERSAVVVDRLLAAGAILIGKTNLDQFATGLVGTRSPYGACQNAFNPDYISGGSSSGSAVAVASGLVSFALGTDTAGSGRVPAAFNNIIGLKPSADRIPTEGIVPACKSLDCVSIFSLTTADAEQVLSVASGQPPAADGAISNFRFGVPRNTEFFGDSNNPTLFADAIQRLRSLGGSPVEIDFEPFLEVGHLLYEGPWVAERYAAIRPFFDADPEQLLPVSRGIIGRGRDFTAVDVFEASYRLAELRRRVEPTWDDIDLLLVPSSPSIYTIAEVEAEPVELNSKLGYYTNFVNLLGQCALAVPAAIRDDGLPFGVTLIAPNGHDSLLTDLGKRLHNASGLPLGATGKPQPLAGEGSGGTILLAVVGAHLSGQPLNHQLTHRGGRLLRSTRTLPLYQLYALTGTTPAKPGLIRSSEAGHAIDLEVWELTPAAFGCFVAEIPSPLGIGTLLLDDGSKVKGFLCEPHALSEAEDISRYGGWRAYLKATDSKPLSINT